MDDAAWRAAQGLQLAQSSARRSPHRVVVACLRSVVYLRVRYRRGIRLPRPEMGRLAGSQVAAAGLNAARGRRRARVDGGLKLLSEADRSSSGWRDDTGPRGRHDRRSGRHARGARLMSTCSGVSVIAATGLLACRRAKLTGAGRPAGARVPDVEVDPEVLYGTRHPDVGGRAAG